MTRFLLSITAALMAFPATGQQMVQPDVEAWLRGYETAWEDLDADAAARLFTSDALYFETPWSEPFEGRDGIAEYWTGVTADQRNVDFEFDVIAINGSTAVARWNARFELASTGAELALDGVFVLEFADGDAVSELREWWVLRP